MRGTTFAVVVFVYAVGLLGCGPQARRGDDGACTDGALHCVGTTLQTCQDGKFIATEDCENACSEAVGCSLCAPGTGTCNGNMAHACNADGTGFVDTDCDPVQGMSCDSATGTCAGACAAQNIAQSYIGCEYYPTITGNPVSSSYDFAVAISNTTADVATVTIEGGMLGAPSVVTVQPNSVTIQSLPWHPQLKLCANNAFSSDCIGTQTNGAMAIKGAYHLRSTQPVTVYQFNTLEYIVASAPEPSYTNDASLLLPTNVWKNDYITAAFQQVGGSNPSQFAVTARLDNTHVTITTRAQTDAAGGAPAFAAGTPQMVTLNAGDVIELASLYGDFTGSRVTSDLPVQVISGHYCADVPVGIAACDHLEESMFSIDALGKNYVINAPAVTSIPSGKVELVRIIATQPNTNVVYSPAQTGAGTTLANVGDFIEIQNTNASFMIQADQKVLVAQYMEGQEAGGGTGDPAMALAVPVEQFRDSYLFHAPTNYESNYVDVTAPTGATVTLDGAPLAFTAIGSTGYGMVRVYPLTAGPGNDGNHSISGDMAFGITVYGYGQYTSYWYPGGLNLTSILE